MSPKLIPNDLIYYLHKLSPRIQATALHSIRRLSGRTAAESLAPLRMHRACGSRRSTLADFYTRGVYANPLCFAMRLCASGKKSRNLGMSKVSEKNHRSTILASIILYKFYDK